MYCKVAETWETSLQISLVSLFEIIADIIYIRK